MFGQSYTAPLLLANAGKSAMKVLIAARPELAEWITFTPDFGFIQVMRHEGGQGWGGGGVGGWVGGLVAISLWHAGLNPIQPRQMEAYSARICMPGGAACRQHGRVGKCRV
jgi:hypothetical protein